jgi:serine/threonine protein kinase
MALAAAPEVPGFRALSPLGYGPASTLYSAQSDALGRWVALTVYSTSLHDERTQRRFTRAFETARRLGSHPNAVTMLESGLTLDRRPYVASEIYERGTLDGRIAGRKSLTVEQALHMGICVAGALETAHRADVIHGGVHPARVLVGRDGEPALADMGLVPLVERGGLAALVGPMSYHAAPEVLEGDPVSPATDVYSLASTIYAGLSCRPPYRGGDEDDTVASLLLRILQHAVTPMARHDVPPFLEQVLHQALSCEAKERPERPLVLAKAMQTCQAHLGLPVTEPVVLDIAASLRLAAGDGITGQADANGYGATTPMSTNGTGAEGQGDPRSIPLPRHQPGPMGGDAGTRAGAGAGGATVGAGTPVQRVFVPYPAEPSEPPSPPASSTPPRPSAPSAPNGLGPGGPDDPGGFGPTTPPGDIARRPLDEPALREAGFPEPPPPQGPALAESSPWDGLRPSPPRADIASAPAARHHAVPPADIAPAPAARHTPAPPAGFDPSPPGDVPAARSYSAASSSTWADVQPDTDADPWADLQLDPAVLAGERPAYDAHAGEGESATGLAQRRSAAAAARTARRDEGHSDDASGPVAPAGPRALPVIVLLALVAVLIAGVTWMIVTGEDPGQDEGGDATSTSQAVDGGADAPTNVEVTAAENAAGVQLDWEQPGEGSQVVVVLSQAEPPQALPADAGTALLVPAARLQPQTGYCFAVVASDGGVPNPAELAASVPEEVLAPSACIRGATAAAVRRA